MLPFKFLLLPLAIVSSATARPQINQDITANYGNDTLGKNDGPALPPIQPQSPHLIRFTHSQPTKRAVTLPSGWRSGFCVEDSSTRVLSTHLTSSTSMTPTLCINTCSSLGYSYAGVEHGSGCYCGNSLYGPPTVTPDSECNVPCSGDSSQTCGAGNRLFWYSDSANAPYRIPTTTITAAPAPTDILSGWTRTKCMQDGPTHSLSDYSLAGVQNGNKCSAGQVVSDSECTVARYAGDGKPCGNGWRAGARELEVILSRYNQGGSTSTPSAATLTSTSGTITTRSESLGGSSTTTTGSSSTTLPAKRVVAHHMVGNTYPYTLDTWSTDISLALSAGIDGFALNVGSGGVGNWQREQVKNAYDAAAALGASGSTFGLFLSLDMT
jgi:glucan endo-1,3-alpha-glucosidase